MKNKVLDASVESLVHLHQYLQHTILVYISIFKSWHAQLNIYIFPENINNNKKETILRSMHDIYTNF